MILTRADIRLGNLVKVENVQTRVVVRSFRENREMTACELSKYVFMEMGFERLFQGDAPYYYSEKHGLTFRVGSDGRFYWDHKGVVFSEGFQYAHQLQNVVYACVGVEL